VRDSFSGRNFISRLHRNPRGHSMATNPIPISTLPSSEVWNRPNKSQEGVELPLHNLFQPERRFGDWNGRGGGGKSLEALKEGRGASRNLAAACHFD
jgi:hypothetical protein